MAVPKMGYLVRSGREGLLLGELAPERHARQAGSGFVVADGRPKDAEARHLEPVFARQIVLLEGPPIEADTEAIAERLASLVPAQPWTIVVMVPDGGVPRDPRRRIADRIDEEVGAALQARIGSEAAAAFTDELEDAAWVLQVVVVTRSEIAVGLARRSELFHPIAASRRKNRRAARLEDAFALAGVTPDPGEEVVELGGRGSWAIHATTYGAKVLAVGARGAPEVPVEPSNPFEFAATQTWDWVLIDMPRRALEVARLLGKWGRRAWARQVIASLRLPDRDPLATIREAREILEEAGWRGIHIRQLPADADEVTLTAWLDPKLAARGPREPFGARMKAKRELRESLEARRHWLDAKRERKRKSRAKALEE